MSNDELADLKRQHGEFFEDLVLYIKHSLIEASATAAHAVIAEHQNSGKDAFEGARECYEAVRSALYQRANEITLGE